MENVKFTVALRQHGRSWTIAVFEFDNLHQAKDFASTLLTHQRSEEGKELFDVCIWMDKVILTANEESEDE